MGADTINHLIKAGQQIQLESKELGYEFRCYAFDPLPDKESKEQTKDNETHEVNAIYEGIPIKEVICISH